MGKSKKKHLSGVLEERLIYHQMILTTVISQKNL